MLYVAPEFRRHGVAGELLTATLTWLRERNVTEVEASVLAANEASLELFGKHGFHPTSHILRVRL
jgi:RimJ/RimL family protein N-acetyltransferase